MTFVAVDQNRGRLAELTRLLLEAFPGSVNYQHTNPLKAPRDVRGNRVDAVFAQLDPEDPAGAALPHMLHLEKADLPVFLLSDAERGGRPTPGNNVTDCLARPLSAEMLRESLNGILRYGVSGLQKACV